MRPFTRRQYRGDERGLALVEFALVVPIIAMLVLGVIEYGNAWRQTNAIERATQQAGRTVASQANGRMADFETLRAIDSATRNLGGIEIVAVVIYDATGRADGSLPSENCRDGSVGGLCNHYTGAQVRTIAPTGFPGTGTCGGGWDSEWCPLDRDRDPGTDALRLGVLIIADYEAVTGMLPGPIITIERSTTYQIEPCIRGQEEC